jgi:hypothetical protein
VNYHQNNLYEKASYKNELIERKDKIQSTYANAPVKVKARKAEISRCLASDCQYLSSQRHALAMSASARPFPHPFRRVFLLGITLPSAILNGFLDRCSLVLGGTVWSLTSASGAAIH